METPKFEEGEVLEQPERSVRQEKKERADRMSLNILHEILDTVEEEMKEVRTIHFAGREYSIEDSYDLQLAREQHIVAHLEARLGQAREENDYYLEQALAQLHTFEELNASVITHSAELHRSYPQSAEFLIHDGEHRDTSQYT